MYFFLNIFKDILWKRAFDDLGSFGTFQNVKQKNKKFSSVQKYFTEKTPSHQFSFRFDLNYPKISFDFSHRLFPHFQKEDFSS